jgi:hypothetical protein
MSEVALWTTMEKYTQVCIRRSYDQGLLKLTCHIFRLGVVVQTCQGVVNEDFSPCHFMTFVALRYGIILHTSFRISPDAPFVPFRTVVTNIKWLLKKSSSGWLKFSTEENVQI